MADARVFTASQPYPAKAPDGSDWPDGTLLFDQDDQTTHFWNEPTKAWVAIPKG